MPNSFALLRPRAQAALAAPSHVWTLPDGQPWCEIHRIGCGYLMRFPTLADFLLARDGDVECHPVPGIDRHTIDHLHRNQVIPALMGLRGTPVFHGGANVIDGRAVAFLGQSGRGKSTLVTSLAISGHAMLTDDGLHLEQDREAGGFVVHPSHPAVRLWADSEAALLPPGARREPPVAFTQKARFLGKDLLPVAAAPAPLERAYFLGDGSATSIEIARLTPAIEHMEWIGHSFVADPHDRVGMAARFRLVEHLCALGLGYRLDYPRRYDQLGGVHRVLCEHMKLG